MTTTITESDVEFQSVLRIRPLQKKEKDDHVVLEASSSANSSKNKRTTSTTTAVLHPLFVHMTSPDTIRNRGSFSSPIQNTEESVYHFDKIFDTNSTQDTLHYAIGLSMASHAMEPLKTKSKQQTTTTKNHLVITTGMTNSGKSYTVFGGTTKRTKPHADDGLIPRILESLFSQSKHHVSSKSSFAIRMTILYVEGDKVHDLLSDENAPDSASKTRSSGRSGGGGGVRTMVANFEKGRAHDDDGYGVAAEQNSHAYKTCWNATEARETLNTGLARAANQSSSSSRFGGAFGGGGGKASSSTRGHTMVTIQPLLIQGRRRDSRAVDRCGGTIAVLDMAGIERVKNKGRSKHDSVAVNSSHSAVMHVLRTLKHNADVKEGKEPLAVFRGDDGDDSSDGSDISNVSEPKGGAQHARSLKIVPYRQSQVTMLLQPFFSSKGDWNGSKVLGRTIVTTILAAYPGHRDYSEKQSLLNDMDLIFGAEMTRKLSHRVHTGMTSSAKPVKKKAFSKHEQDLGGTAEKPKAKAQQKSSSPAYTPSAPAEDYGGPIDMEDDMPLAPIPPPYNATPVMASAPSDADIDPDPSPSLPVSRAIAQDFPGVAIPVKTSPAAAVAARKVIATSSAKEPSHYSSQRASPSPGHSNTATPLMAKVGSSPNIRPPSSSRKTPLKGETKSPTWSLKAQSPLKSISRAVNASKKKGKLAMEELVDSAPYSRRPVGVDQSASKESLIRQVKELQDENEVLSSRNEALEERCEKLESERDQLKRSLREATGRLSQSWTEQDEQEWQRSKRLRVQEQRLIGSPLQQHIAHVEATHEISCDWVHHGGKPPFALKFPTSWTPARVLNDREHNDEEK
jgi:hypothetical protein